MTTTREQQPEPVGEHRAKRLPPAAERTGDPGPDERLDREEAPAGRADHGPFIAGGIAARPERPITDYLWSADPPERTLGREAEAG
jgi:hypothetical protein